MWALGEDQLVIPRLTFIHWATALIYIKEYFFAYHISCLTYIFLFKIFKEKFLIFMQHAKITTSKQYVINIQNKNCKLTSTNLQVYTSINSVFLKIKGYNDIIEFLRYHCLKACLSPYIYFFSLQTMCYFPLGKPLGWPYKFLLLNSH